MAGTITKQLKLKATLDDQQLKQQIKELKQELGKLKVGSADMSAFDASVQGLQDAANSLKQAIAEMKKGGGFGGFGTGGPAKKEREAKSIKEIVEQVTKNTSKRNQTYFDPESGRYISLKKGEVYDKAQRKKFKSEEDQTKALELFKEREQTKRQKVADKETLKLEKQKAQMAEAERKKNVGAAKDMATALLSRTGIGLPMARQTTQALGEMAPGLMGRGGALLRGAGSFLSSGMGLALGGTAAVAGLGIMGYMNNQARSREFRVSAARQQQEEAMSVLQGRGIEGSILKESRKDVGSVERGLSGVGGFLSSFNPFSENFATNPMEAARQRIRDKEEGAQQARLAETELGRSALETRKGLRQARLNALRGGGVGGTLTQLQSQGADLGFSQEQTLEQFSQSRDILGNTATSQLLTGMQDMMNRTGLDVGSQADVISKLTGATRGTSYEQSFQKTQEMTKKAVAAGMDASRTGKYLQTTAEYVSATQGLGQVDTDAIAQRILDSASGFAGGGPITDTALQQARSLEQLRMQMSTSTSGGAGAANVMAAQEMFGDDPGKFLQAMNLSTNATAAETAQILGVDEATAQKFLDLKSKNILKGEEILGGGRIGEALMAKESGQTTEQYAGLKRGLGGKAGTGGTGTPGLPPPPGGGDFNSLVADFKAKQIAFNEGLGLMTTETGKVTTGLSNLEKAIKKSVEAINKTIDNEAQ